MKKVILSIFVVFMGLAALSQPQPVITGDDMLCPDGTGVLSTQEFESYQWFRRYYGSTQTQAIDGANGQSLLMDYYNYAASYISVQVTQAGQTATSAEFFVDGYAFLPAVIMSEGDYYVNEEGEFVICPGDTLFLSLMMPYTVNITWYKNGNPMEGETGTTLAVTKPGAYYVEGAPEVCPDFIQGPGLEIVVVYCPGALNPEISGDDMLCPEGTGVLSTQVFETYQWLRRYYGSDVTEPIEGANSQSLVMDYYNYAASYISVQVTQAGQTATSDEFFVDGHAFVPVTVAAEGQYIVNEEGEFVICPGDKVYFTINPPYTVNITWYKNGVPIEGQNGEVLMVTEPGAYYVEGAPEICPEFIDGPGLELVVVYCSGVSVPDMAMPEFKVGPVPATESLHVSIPGLSSGDFFVYNILGKKVMQGVLSSEISRIDISGLDKGVYILQVNANGLTSRKFIKQ